MTKRKLGLGTPFRHRYAAAMTLEKDDLARMNQVLRHRLRNVASGVKSAVSYLSKELDERLGPDEKEYFPLIIRECDALSDLTGRLNLILENVEPGTHSDFGQVLTRVQSLVQERVAGADIRVDVKDAARAVPVGRGRWLQVVLEEVITNAIEASPLSSAEVAAELDGQVLALQVSNEGPDLAEADLEAFFQPFYSTRTRQLGVGLTVARRLLDSLGGSIQVARRASGGLDVRMALPLAGLAGN